MSKPKFDIQFPRIKEARETGVLTEHEIKELAGAFLHLYDRSQVDALSAEMDRQDRRVRP